MSAPAYTHEQAAPSGTWQIPHMLGFKPSVRFIDTAGREIHPDSAYTTMYETLAFFKTPIAGQALCSLEGHHGG